MATLLIRFARGKIVNGQTSVTPNFIQSFLQTPSAHSNPTSSRIKSHLLNFSTSTASTPCPLFYIDDTVRQLSPPDLGLIELVKSTKPLLPSVPNALDILRKSGVQPEIDSLKSVIWNLKDEWKLALLIFKWSQECCGQDEKLWSLMIWVLGSSRKFNVAWSLIRDLYRLKINARCSMLVMIER